MPRYKRFLEKKRKMFTKLRCDENVISLFALTRDNLVIKLGKYFKERHNTLKYRIKNDIFSASC